MVNANVLEIIKKNLEVFLNEKKDKDILTFLMETYKFTAHYAASCELSETLYLVLDNSIIQEIKHRKDQSHRAIKAEAYLTFCKFVKYWSNTTTFIAISPMVVYEHLGRKIPKTRWELQIALNELHTIICATTLEIRYLGFCDAESLYPLLENIVHDEVVLTTYIKNLDERSWKTDLSHPHGVKIPMSIASKSLPTLPQLKYFRLGYIHFVLSGRVEKYIIEQSKHNPNAMPIGGGDLPNLFYKINTYKKDLLKGLGDIDIFQICDVSGQCSQNSESYFIGQTLDKDLRKILNIRHVKYSSVEFVVGESSTNKEDIKNLLSVMLDPFEEDKKRSQLIQPKFSDFIKFIEEICDRKLLQLY